MISIIAPTVNSGPVLVGMYGTLHTSERYTIGDGTNARTAHTSGRTYVGTVHDFSVLYRHCYRLDQRDLVPGSVG